MTLRPILGLRPHLQATSLTSRICTTNFPVESFSSSSRRYPIAFPYPFTEDDELSVQLPDGYEVEEPPYRRKAGLSYAGYEISSTIEDRHLVTRRKIRLDGVQFPPEKYEELKNFFSIVHRGDTGQAVLRQPAAAKARNQK